MPVTNITPIFGGAFSAPNATEVTRQLLVSDYLLPYMSADPVIRKEYWCSVVGQCTFGTWLTENMGYGETCWDNYNIVHRYPADQIVKLGNVAPIVVPAYTAGTNTVVIPLPTGEHFISGKYSLPNVGDGLLLPPQGQLAIVTAVSKGTANSHTITIRQQIGGNVAITIPALAEVVVLGAQEIADCQCPSGQLNFEPDFVEQQIIMKKLFKATGDICDNAIEACFNQRLMFERTNAKGEIEPVEWWFGGAVQTMYQNFEKAKDMYFLFDNSWGIIPTLKAKSIRWNWADATELAEADLQDLKDALIASGAMIMEHSLFLGSDAFVSAQKLAHELGKGFISGGCFNPEDCKWINLNYCAIYYYGIRLHIYEDCAFSHPQMLGAAGFDWKNKGIGVPMGNKPGGCVRIGERDDKMFNVIYKKDSHSGRVHNMLMDSNGYLPGSNKNTYGTGCFKQSYSVESKFAVEVVNPQHWILVNFPA